MYDIKDHFHPSKSADEFPLPTGFNSGVIEIDGRRLYAVHGGAGSLALLVHGFGQSWYEWHQLMPELAATHTVVAVDLPGLGLSESPPDYSGQAVAATLHRLARTLSPEAPFKLVAHDIGIWNTYPMVVTHEADLDCVVYMEAPIPDPTMYEFPAFSPAGESLVWHFSFFAADNQLAETLITGHEQFFLTHFIHQHATQKMPFDDALMARYAASYGKPHSLHASFEYYRSINRTIDQNKQLKSQKPTLPILAIGGGGHGGMGQYQIDQTRRYFENAEGQVIADAGHWLPEEAPAQINTLVVDFLNRNR